MAESPNLRAKDIVSVTVLSKGKPIKDTYQLIEVSVEHELNMIPLASIRLIDGDVAEKDFPIANSSDFVPGSDIEIQAGYDGENKTIFKGIVVSMRISLDSNQGSVLEVISRDKCLLMTETRKNAYYGEVKDSDIISTLINNYSGLTAEVESTAYQHKELLQYDASDWDFMMIRADVNGLVASINAGKVSIKKPDVGSSPVLTLTYGVDLIDFEANLSAKNQVSEVEAFSWDSSTQQIVKSSSSKPSLPSIGNINGDKLGSDLGIPKGMLVSSAQVDNDLLKLWADTKLLKTRLSGLKGTASFLGSSLALPNSIIEIKGVGDRFSGKAFVSAVTHHIHEGMWKTEIRFGMDDNWFAAKPNVNALPASGLTPQIGGLMIGKVKKLDEDPDNENRIQVTLPMMQDETSAIWARLATFYATNEKGNFFIPEIDDEVVIGFLNSDPNFPIILGSLYSSKAPPPYELTADNFTKAIVTKSECKIEFDDEKKVITIATPAKNEIIINDDEKSIKLSDENGNVIEMSADGIKIDSCKDLTITAKQNIKLNATSNIETQSTADTTIKGMNVTGTADVGMTMKGSATSEFSASGQTTIKGAIVMIN